MTTTVPNKVHFLAIDENASGQRVDNFLIRYLHHVPKTHIYKIIRKGEVRVDKKRVKPEYKLKLGDQLRIPPVKVQETTTLNPNESLLEMLETTIIYEDDNVLVMNKPTGLAVHGGSGILYGLIEAVRKMRPKQTFLELVHRLDKATSGCILIAKNRISLTTLHEQLRNNKTEKHYTALVCGAWKGGERKVNQPLKKNTLKSGERIVTIDPDGKASTSFFRPLKKYAQYTLVDVKIITGRTHQIRVHGQYIDHCIAGDGKYGNFAANQRLKNLGLNRLFLHSQQISVMLPNKDHASTFSAPLPKDLQALVQQLDGQLIS